MHIALLLAVIVLPFITSCARQDASVKPEAEQANLIANVVMLKTRGGRVDWSPVDDDLIAFDREGDDGYYDVYTMRTDGTEEFCLTCDRPELPGRHMGNPAWHPSGRWIVFQAEKREHPGASLSALPGLGKHNDLWVGSRDGEQFYQLTDTPANGDSGTLHPHFSKDGRRISWSEMVHRAKPLRAERRFGLWQLKIGDFVIGRSGPALVNVKSFQPGGPAFYENHGFSPDGRTLLYTSNQRGGRLFKENKIYALDLATGASQILTDNDAYNEHAIYSRDGRRILWATSFQNSRRGLDWWVMDADGSDKQRVTNFNDPRSRFFSGLSVTADASWSPRGDRFVGYVQDNLLKQTGKIVVVQLRQQ